MSAIDELPACFEVRRRNTRCQYNPSQHHAFTNVDGQNSISSRSTIVQKQQQHFVTPKLLCTTWLNDFTTTKKEYNYSNSCVPTLIQNRFIIMGTCTGQIAVWDAMALSQQRFNNGSKQATPVLLQTIKPSSSTAIVKICVVTVPTNDESSTNTENASTYIIVVDLIGTECVYEFIVTNASTTKTKPCRLILLLSTNVTNSHGAGVTCMDCEYYTAHIIASVDTTPKSDKSNSNTNNIESVTNNMLAIAIGYEDGSVALWNMNLTACKSASSVRTYTKNLEEKLQFRTEFTSVVFPPSIANVSFMKSRDEGSSSHLIVTLHHRVATTPASSNNNQRRQNKSSKHTASYQQSLPSQPRTVSFIEVLYIASLSQAWNEQSDIDDSTNSKDATNIDIEPHCVYPSNRTLMDASAVHTASNSHPAYIPSLGTNCMVLTNDGNIGAALSDGTILGSLQIQSRTKACISSNNNQINIASNTIPSPLHTSEWDKLDTANQFVLSYPAVGMGNVQLLCNNDDDSSDTPQSTHYFRDYLVCTLRSGSVYLLPPHRQSSNGVYVFSILDDKSDDNFTLTRQVHGFGSGMLHQPCNTVTGSDSSSTDALSVQQTKDDHSSIPIAMFVWSNGVLEVYQIGGALHDTVSSTSDMTILEELLHNGSVQLLHELLSRTTNILPENKATIVTNDDDGSPVGHQQQEQYHENAIHVVEEALNQYSSAAIVDLARNEINALVHPHDGTTCDVSDEISLDNLLYSSSLECFRLLLLSFATKNVTTSSIKV